MKVSKTLCLVLVCSLFSIYLSNAQDPDLKFGIKGGVNYAQYTPDPVFGGVKAIDYQRKLGFYVGGFANIGLNESLKLQPELIFTLQGTRTFADILIADEDGNFFEEEFRSNINEYTIAIPVVLQYYVTDNFYFEGGPQLALIVSRDENITDNPFGEPNNPPVEFEYDTFDFGINLGTGYSLAESFRINLRYLLGILERDGNIKTSVFYLGIEHDF
jgi:hypothetical protein